MIKTRKCKLSAFEKTLPSFAERKSIKKIADNNFLTDKK